MLRHKGGRHSAIGSNHLPGRVLRPAHQLVGPPPEEVLPVLPQPLVPGARDARRDPRLERCPLRRRYQLQELPRDIVAIHGGHKDRHLLPTAELFDDFPLHLPGRAQQDVLDDIRRELLDAQLDQLPLEGLHDGPADLAAPLEEGVLHHVVPVGALHQVEGLPADLVEEPLLVLAGLALGDALLHHAQAVGVVRHGLEAAHHLVHDELRAWGTKTYQGPLYHVRAVQVTTELDNMPP
mmetsp:Transcript_4959/g.13953  ORF Transcript_4959/g.13953 Transcript_4959/m.13953 type:complete len:237 (+) Transcript_4959:66-776(+)